MPVTESSIADLIQAIDQADSAAGLVRAVRSLATARSEAGIPTLIQVLGYNNPGAALAAVDGLVQLGPLAVVPLLEQIDGYNYGARAYSIRALATIADPRALDILLQAAETDFAPSVRRAAIRGLGNLHWEQLEGEAIAVQQRVVQTLIQVSHDPEWVVRYAAIAALQNLMQALAPHSPAAAELFQVAQGQLQTIIAQEGDDAVRARAVLAQQQVAGAS